MDTKTQVFLFDNVISNDLCDSIRILIDKSDGTITEYAKGENVRCKVANIENPKLRKLIDDELYNVVSSIIAKIRETCSMRISGDTGYCLRKIHGATRLHTDGVLPQGDNLESPRSMSVIVALNDDYEGGELCFPNQDLKIKLKKSQAIAFPPYWTHPHYTNVPLNGTFRYTVNTWLTE